MNSQPRLLLIEHLRTVAEPLAQALSASHVVDIATNGEKGIFKSTQDSYSAIILELNLPDLSGLAVCEELRNRGATVPILIISNETDVLTKIKLLDAGADDYLTKPFSLGELKARLRVLSRRSSEQPTLGPQVLTVGDLTMDQASRQVSREGLPLNLRRKEFAILECLMQRAGTVVTRDTLTRFAWDGSNESWTNTIDVHIKYLRDKIDRPFGFPMIKTVHGLGYRLETAPLSAKLQPALV